MRYVYRKPSDPLLTTMNQNEMYFTMDEDKNPLDVLIEICRVVSFSEFQKLEGPRNTRNVFFTRRGFNSNKGLFTEELDWNRVYNSDFDTCLLSIELALAVKAPRRARSANPNTLIEKGPTLLPPSSTIIPVSENPIKEEQTDQPIAIKMEKSKVASSPKRTRRKKEEMINEVQTNDLIANKPDLLPAESASKRRGRPKKVVSNDMSLIEEASSPKRRGRAKKIQEPEISSTLSLPVSGNATDISAKIDLLAKKVKERAKQKASNTVLELPSTNTKEDDVKRSHEDLDEEFEDAGDEDPDFDEPEPESEKKPIKKMPTTPRKRRKVTPPTTPTAKTPKTSPRKNRSPIKDFLRTPTRKIVIKAPRSTTTLPNRLDGVIEEDTASPHQAARGRLHVSTVPDSLPCRENEFSQIFLALESAINAETGSCIYVSGTPGTGKTATVREVISQLQLRCQEGELPEFSFIEINGMKLINPQESYEILWEEISGHRVSASNAVALLEKEFKVANPKRVPVLVLMDEMDQLVTKSQGVMYNFFNWPTFRNSKLIVVAVANTMDLPERMLSNKISSRLGLTRIQFPGYNHEQLREIIESRLLDVEGQIVERDAIEFASRKVASVSGDARRALDICRRAVELAEMDAIQTNHREQVKISHIKRAIDETTNSPLFKYLQELPLACKIFLSAVLARVRRSGLVENPLGDILEETQRLCKLSQKADKLLAILYGDGRIRMRSFLKAVTELVEGGVLVQQNMRGERSGRIRLTIAEEEVKSAFKNDKEIEGMM